jgi:hypothetical protein
MRAALPLLAGAALLLSACAAPIIGGLTLSQLSSASSLASSGLTGKSLTEMAMDLVTGKDCRIMEGLVRDDRQICEERDSPATYDDFNGVMGLVRNKRSPIDAGIFVNTGDFQAPPAPASVIKVSVTDTQAE